MEVITEVTNWHDYDVIEAISSSNLRLVYKK